MFCCTFRPLFSRVKEEKEEGTEVALAGKDGTGRWNLSSLGSQIELNLL